MPEAYTLTAANRLGALALAVSDRLRDAAENATGLGGAAPAALVSLREWAEGSSVEVLAEAMGVSHSRAVRVVDRLEEAQLARREPDPSDGRRALVRLEPAGKKLADRALKARARVLELFVAELGAGQVAQLDGLLAALLDAAIDDERAARQTCRLCDVHVCGHFEGLCPVTRAADRARAQV